MKSMKLFGENDMLHFGKYPSIKLCDLINKDSQYLLWIYTNGIVDLTDTLLYKLSDKCKLTHVSHVVNQHKQTSETRLNNRKKRKLKQENGNRFYSKRNRDKNVRPCNIEHCQTESVYARRNRLGLVEKFVA